jgi:hypothetical protein
MWILLNDQEIKYYRKKRILESLKGSFAISVLFLIFITIMFKFGCRGRDPHQYEQTWSQVIETLPQKLIIIPIVMSLFTLGIYLEGSNYCEKCLKKSKKGISTCSCGGKVIDLHNYRWVDDLENNGK